jgi:hypothetical protein
VGATGFIGIFLLPLCAAFSSLDMAAKLACDAAFWLARWSALRVGAAGGVGASAACACTEKAPVAAESRKAANIDLFMGCSNHLGLLKFEKSNGIVLFDDCSMWPILVNEAHANVNSR